MEEKNTTSTNIIRHIWSVLCQKSSIDKDSNSLTLTDVLQQITIDRAQLEQMRKRQAKDKIAIPVPFELVTIWDRKDTGERNITGRTRVIDPTGKILLEQVHKLKFEKDKKGLRFRVRMLGMPITNAGEYVFTVEIREEGHKDFEERGRIPLTIKMSDISKKNNK